MTEHESGLVRPTVVMFLACTVTLCCGFDGFAFESVDEPPVPDEPMVLRTQSSDGTFVSVSIQMELLNDSPTTGLFNWPVMVAVDARGRSYWSDGRDMDVKVLSPGGEHVDTFGRKGSGPGEFQNTWLLTISPDEELWVHDRTKNMLEIFTLDGEHVESVRPPWPRLSPNGLSFLSGGELAVATSRALQAGWRERPINIYRVEGPVGSRWLLRVAQMHESPGFEQVISTRVSGGWLAAQPNGGFVFTQRTPYRVTSYSSDLQVEWDIKDAERLGSVATYFSFAENGRVRFDPFPAAWSILPLGPGYYMHILFEPPEGLTLAEARANNLPAPRTLELIEVALAGGIRRTDFDLDGIPFTPLNRDASGRVYGLWGNYDYSAVRATIDVSVTETDGSG